MVILLQEEKGNVGMFENAVVRMEGSFSFLEVEEEIMQHQCMPLLEDKQGQAMSQGLPDLNVEVRN